MARCLAGANGQTSGIPSLFRYQLSQPVVQTVFGIAARNTVLYASVAADFGSMVSNSPWRHHR